MSDADEAAQDALAGRSVTDDVDRAGQDALAHRGRRGFA